MQIALTPALKKMADNFITLFENGTISGIINWLKDFGIATYKTIVVDDDMFKFLEKYNLRVISLEDNDNLTDKL